MDENAGILPFIKKKVEGFSLHSTNRSRTAIYFSPIWNGWPQVFNTGPLPFFCVEKAGKIAVFHTGKSCCSRVRREQTPPVSLRSTDSPFCRCAPSAPLFVTYGDISPRRGENLSRPGEVVLWDVAFGSTEKFPAKVQSLRVRQRLPPRGSWQNR